MKRVISFLLTIALLFGLMGTTGVQVFAQTQVMTETAAQVVADAVAQQSEYIHSVQLDNLPECIYPGAAELPSPTVLEGDCQITGVQWVNQEKQPVDAFEIGQGYYLAISLKTETGLFNMDLYAYFQGEKQKFNTDMTLLDDQSCTVYIPYTVVPATNGLTEHVRVWLPEIAPGDPIPEIPWFLVNGCTVTDCMWLTDVEVGGCFQDGIEYGFTATLVAEEGRPFAPYAATSESLEGSWSGNSFAPNEDYTTYQMVVTFWVNFNEIYNLELEGAPYSIEAGEAVRPDIFMVDGLAELGDVYWVDEEKNPVTMLEDGKAYYLAVEMCANGNYIFAERLYVHAYARDEVTLDRKSDREAVVYIRYSLEPETGSIRVAFNMPAQGMDVAALTATVEGNAVLEAITVCDDSNGEYLESGVFEDNKNYTIRYKLRPMAGYQFGEQVELDVLTDKVVSWYSEPQYLYFEYRFSTCDLIPLVEVTMESPKPGNAVKDAVPVVPEGAPYTLVACYWYDYTTGCDATDVFLPGHQYGVSIDLRAAEGYAFDPEETKVWLNGEQASWDVYGDYASLYYNVSFGIDFIELGNLPHQIEAGAVEIPEVFDGHENVTITKVQWVDTAYKKVTSLKEGKIYYLAVTMKPNEGKTFNTEISMNEICSVYVDDYKYVSEKEAVIYIRYSLEPEVGKVILTPTVLKEGLDISKITGTVSGNATLQKVEVYTIDDYNEWIPCTSGKLAANTNYAVRYLIAPKSGYQLGGGSELTIQTECNVDYNYYDDVIYAEVFFSTCPKISQVEFSIEGVELGKKVNQVKAIVPAGAKYRVELSVWDATEDWDEATGTFQDMHKYEVSYDVIPDKGYVLDTEVQVTIDGKTTTGYTYGSGNYFCGWTYYSFLKPLDKVEFPALPTSIKKGQTLKTDFTAPAGANYTYYAEWCIMDEGLVEKADKNASYVLYFCIQAKPGYEVTEDTKVYIDGKQTLDYIPDGSSGVFLYRVYNIGMNEIDRIDLTVPAAAAGAKPGTATVSKDAKYTLEDQEWSYSYEGSIMDMQTVSTFKKDTYIFITTVFAAKKGYVFAEDVAIYINGEKATSLRGLNIGSYVQQIYGLGKVGDQPVKLETPKLTVSGTAITWSANGAASYEVYRSTSKSGTYKLLQTVIAEGETVIFVDESATAGKTYYYKVKAISAAGSKYSSGNSAVASVAFPLNAPEISMSYAATGKVVISWSKISGAKSYDVYRADWENFEKGNFTKLGNTKSASYTDTKAEVGIEYFYCVVAVGSSSAYNSGYSNVYMGNAKCATPAVKITLDKATGKPSLSWAKIAGAVSYGIFRQMSGEEAFTLIAEQTEVTFVDTTAPLDSKCTYYVQAMGQHENCHSAYSNKVTESVALGIPALKGGNDANGRPTFTWQSVEGAVKYEISRSTKSSSGFKVIDTVEDGTAYTDETATAGKTYYYQVVAVGENTKSKASTAVKLVPTCAVPVADITTDQKTGKPVISWEKVSGAKSYDVYYATSENGTYKKLGNTKSTSYTDTKITTGTVRYYKVRAVGSKSAYNSPFGKVMMGTGFCATPVVKITTDATSGKPSLSWSKISGASGYRIFRMCRYQDADFVELTTVTGTSFVDTTAPINTYCFYMVQAMHQQEGLSSALSAVVEITAKLGRPTNVKGSVNDAGLFVLTWEPVEGAFSYEVFRSTKATSGFKSIGTTGYEEFGDANAPGKTYYYKVRALGSVSRSEQTAAVKLVGKCAQPVAQAGIDIKSGKPVIAWEKVSGAKKYEIYRATSVDGKYSKIGTSTKLTYTDTKAAVGSTYYYKVVAAGSKSAYNSVMSAATEAMPTLMAQPTVTVKNDSKTGMPVVSWKSVSGAKEYIVMYADVTEFIDDLDKLTDAYLEENMLSITTTKTSVTLPDTEVDHVYLVTMVAVPKAEEYFSYPTEPKYVEAVCATPKITGFIDAEYGKPGAYWDEVDGAIGYDVYRSTKSGSGYEWLGWVDGDSFVDISAKKGKTYYYKVVAFSEYTESAMSNSVKLKSK